MQNFPCCVTAIAAHRLARAFDALQEGTNCCSQRGVRRPWEGTEGALLSERKFTAFVATGPAFVCRSALQSLQDAAGALARSRPTLAHKKISP